MPSPDTRGDAPGSGLLTPLTAHTGGCADKGETEIGRKPEVEFLKGRATSDTWKSRGHRQAFPKRGGKRENDPEAARPPHPGTDRRTYTPARTHALSLALLPLSSHRAEGKVRTETTRRPGSHLCSRQPFPWPSTAQFPTSALSPGLRRATLLP